MHEITIRQLNHLVALAEEGSFARASERVHLSQPALTRSIQVLEESLGLRLFDRAGRGVAITSAGKLIVERARRVLFETRSLARDAELFGTHEIGEVSIGLAPFPVVITVPDLLVEFAQRYPRIGIKVEAGDALQLVEMIEQERIDFAILDPRAIPANPALTLLRLTRHEAGWFARPDHPVSRRGVLASAALRDYPMASVPLQPFMRSVLRRLLKIRAHENIPLQLECADLRILKSFAMRTHALLFTTASSVRHELLSGELVHVPVSDSLGPGVEFAIVTLADRTPSPAAEIAAVIAQQVMNDARNDASALTARAV